MATEKLTKKVKNKWLKVLRSGKYKQAKGTLFRSDLQAYCCLGVLARVLGLSNEKIEGYAFIPTEFLENTKCNISYSVQDKLSKLNDSKKWSFNKIASYIERYL